MQMANFLAAKDFIGHHEAILANCLVQAQQHDGWNPWIFNLMKGEKIFKFFQRNSKKNLPAKMV
jgi:hypothetical protein